MNPHHRIATHILVYEISRYLSFEDKRTLRTADRTCLANIAWTSQDLQTWLVAAIIADDLTLVERLLSDKRVDPAAGKNASILLASRNGRSSIVKRLLLDERVDPAFENSHALGLACMNGYLDVVKLLLLDKRVDPAANDSHALMVACMNGHYDTVTHLLLDNRVDPAASNSQALVLACNNGHGRCQTFTAISTS